MDEENCLAVDEAKQYSTVSSTYILNDGKEYAVIQSSIVNLLKAIYRRYVLCTREISISS